MYIKNNLMNFGLFQILYCADAIVMLHFTHCHSGCVLERDVDECLLYSHCSSLYLYVERDVASELCGTYVRQQTLRQVSIDQLKLQSN